MTAWPASASKSHQLYQRAREVLPGGISRTMTWIDPYPIYARGGEGPYLEDVDGRRRFDLMNNFAALIHGHAHPAVVEAVSAALRRGSCLFPCPPRARSSWPSCSAAASRGSSRCVFATAGPRP